MIALRLAGTRPDRRRNRDHNGREGSPAPAQGAQFGTTYPRLGSAPTFASPGLLEPDPGPWAACSPNLCSSLPRLLLRRASLLLFRSTNIGLNCVRRARSRGARRGRRQRCLDAELGDALDRGPRRRRRRPSSRSSPPGLHPFITQGQGFMAIVIAMLSAPAVLGPDWPRSCSGSRSRSRRRWQPAGSVSTTDIHAHAPVRLDHVAPRCSSSLAACSARRRSRFFLRAPAPAEERRMRCATPTVTLGRPGDGVQRHALLAAASGSPIT